TRLRPATVFFHDASIASCSLTFSPSATACALKYEAIASWSCGVFMVAMRSATFCSVISSAIATTARLLRAAKANAPRKPLVQFLLEFMDFSLPFDVTLGPGLPYRPPEQPSRSVGLRCGGTAVARAAAVRRRQRLACTKQVRTSEAPPD